MLLSAHRPVLQALLLGVLFAALVAAPAAAAQIDFDAEASGSALGIPTADPGVYAEHITAHGFAPALGHFRLEGHHTANVATGTLANGVLTLTLIPGGDTISGTYSGIAFVTANPKRFDIQGDVVFTGGTGRFARAGGQGEFQGTLVIRSIAPDGAIREAVRLQFDDRLHF